jgi:preprotein translocase subunit SecE
MKAVNSFTNYIKSSYDELKKVVWPTRKQAIKLTIIVIVVSVVLGVILAGLDSFWRLILQKVILRIP